MRNEDGRGGGVEWDVKRGRNGSCLGSHETASRVFSPERFNIKDLSCSTHYDTIFALGLFQELCLITPHPGFTHSTFHLSFLPSLENSINDSAVIFLSN